MKVGTRAIVRSLNAALTLAIILGVASCNSGPGGGGGIHFGPQSSPMTVMLADSGSNEVIEFDAKVSNVTITNTAGIVTTLLSTGPTVEFTHLGLTVQPVVQTTATQDTYNAAAITLSNVHATFVDNTGTLQTSSAAGPFIVTPTLSSFTLGTAPGVVVFDLNLASTVTVNNTTTPPSATFAPAFTVSAASVPSSASTQDVTDGLVPGLDGTVNSIGTSSFVLANPQLNANITIKTNSSTTFSGTGVTGLSTLPVNSSVEVNAVTQSDGSLLATSVEAEEVTAGGQETEGIIAMAPTISSPPATFPNPFPITATMNASTSASVPALGALLNVTTTSGGATPTTYTFDSNLIDTTSIPTTAYVFDATHIANGQNVDVDTATPNATGITADRVKLQQQWFNVSTISSLQYVTNGYRIQCSLPADSYLGFIPPANGGNTAPVVQIIVWLTPTVFPTVPSSLNPALAGTNFRARGLMFWDGTNYHLIATRITAP